MTLASATTNTITFAFNDLSTAITTANASNLFNFLNARVYPACIYYGVAKDADLNTRTELGCGTYHTYAASVVFVDPLDRNMGNYISSKERNSTVVATNKYNVTLYASLYGNFVTGKINSGVVVWSDGSNAAVKIWTMLQVGDNTEKIDFAGQQVDLKTTDSYQSGSAISTQKQDNATGSTNCGNNIEVISAGMGMNPGNLWQYHHFSRNLVVTDLLCDNQIITNTTSICYAWKDGDATLTDFAASPDDRVCKTFVYSWTMSVVLMLLAMLTFQ